MSDDDATRGLLVDTVQRIFADHCTQPVVEAAKKEGWSAALWQILEATRMARVSIPETHGGAGGTVSEMAAVLRVAGRYSAPVPLAETGLLAGWLLSASGAPVPAGPLACAASTPAAPLQLARDGTGWRLTGRIERMPWARVASRLVVLVRAGDADWVASVDPQRCTIRPGSNLAWEPRDDVHFDRVALAPDDVVAAGPVVTAEALHARGALARAVLMAGALDRTLELSVTHARTRVQFGRAIGRFQAVQQELARFAGEVAAAAAAALSAAGRVEDGRGDPSVAIACAKIRAGEAAAAGAAIAHQIHAAIGVTEAFALHHSTLRLQAWRSEFGSEAHWAERLGASVLAAGAERLWPMVTDTF